MHVRRGDFQYRDTRVSAEQVYNSTIGRQFFWHGIDFKMRCNNFAF